MRSFLPLGALFLTVTSAFAQSDHPKAFVGIGGGMSFPHGDFGGTDVKKDKQGYAKNGAFFDINLGYRFANNFGGIVILRGQTNKVDAQAIADQQPIPFDGGEPRYSIKVESGNWTRSGALAGLYGVLPIGVEKKAALEARAMTGSMTATIPERTFTYLSNYLEPVWIRHSATKASAFTYLVGLSFRYNLSSRLALSLSGDYIAAEYNFKDVGFTSNVINSGTTNRKGKIETLNAGLGLAYRFF